MSIELFAFVMPIVFAIVALVSVLLLVNQIRKQQKQSAPIRK